MKIAKLVQKLRKKLQEEETKTSPCCQSNCCSDKNKGLARSVGEGSKPVN